MLATDSFTWDHPQFRGRAAFDLACRATGLHPEARRLDPMELPADLEPFDLVLFLGVFYHLRNPIPAMDALGRLARFGAIVETHQDAFDQQRPAMVFYPGAELGGDATNWWGPNQPLMTQLLLQAGFTRIWYAPHPELGHARGIYAAFKPEAPESWLAGYGEGWQVLAPAAGA